MSATLRVVSHPEDSWPSLRQQWERLLGNSDADGLFLGWDWWTAWWMHFKDPAGESLVAVTVHDGQDLIGAAAMVVSDVTRRPGLRLRSAQCVGYRLDEERGTLSEYLDVVAWRGREEEVRAAIIRELIQRHHCREIVFGWSRSRKEWTSCANAANGVWVRSQPDMPSYQADLSKGFQSYLFSLGSSTRRSIYNLRERLARHGTTEFRIVPLEQVTLALEELNRLHAERWGSPALDSHAKAFHLSMAARQNPGCQAVISVLMVGGRCISVLYDLRISGLQYNLQMGFDQGYDRTISPGLLHLGYAMEQASEAGVQTYDLLAGYGKSTDFKRNLASACCTTQTVVLICGRWPSTVLKAWDWLRRITRPVRKHPWLS